MKMMVAGVTLMVMMMVDGTNGRMRKKLTL